MLVSPASSMVDGTSVLLLALTAGEGLTFVFSELPTAVSGLASSSEAEGSFGLLGPQMASVTVPMMPLFSCVSCGASSCFSMSAG